MPTLARSVRSLLAPLAAALALGATAGVDAAQLDLPRPPSEKPRPAAEKKDEDKPDLPGTSRPISGAEKGAGDISLPAPGPTPAPARPVPASADKSAKGAAPALGVPGPTTTEHVFTELRRGPDPGGNLVRAAGQNLARAGESGLAAARSGLTEEVAAVVVASARALLESGSDADRARVLARLRGALPSKTAGALVDAVLELAPDLLPPGPLCELLDHPQSPVRAAAERQLENRVTPEYLPFLAKAVRSERTDTRLRAVELVTRLSDPAVMHLLVGMLGDSSSKVAHRAARGLAALDDERVEPELLRRAVGERLILREGAYALVALIEREDLTGRPVLGDRHAPVLLENLFTSQQLVSGAAAAALAGIGFRTENPAESPWLDRDVPHQLVRSVSGTEFHRDFTSVRSVAQRRLELISGRALGSDGPAWVRWWLEEESTFHARRSFLSVPPAAVGAIELSYSSLSDGDAFRLIGPEARELAPRGAIGAFEAFHLTAEECADVVGLLRREGVLGAERLPGARGDRGSGARTLTLGLGEQQKSFTFGAGIRAPWFDRTAEMALALRERNRWQLWPDPARHASRRALWEEERDWWGTEVDPLARDRRLGRLILAALPGREPFDRDEGLRELLELSSRPGVLGAGELQPLLDLLAVEPFYGERARRITDLALVAARSAGAPVEASEVALDDGALAAPTPIPAAIARELTETLIRRFGGDAAADLERVFAASEPSLALAAVSDPRPQVRGVAAAALGRNGDEAARAALLALLEDADDRVEASAARALGVARAEEARTELLVRARVGDPLVRAESLVAVGRLGGDDALDALYIGLSEPDPDLRRAAAQGVAELGDPATVPILVSLLGQGPSSAGHAPAREGLLRLGEPAWPELLRAANSTNAPARRDAALLLARQGVPDAASVLMSLLTDDPTDVVLAAELAVLTGVDAHEQADPALSWWNWWDSVEHDDSIPWFLDAARRAGASPPALETLRGEGTREGALFLLDVVGLPEPHLAERGRRELSRLLDRELGALPPRGRARDDWRAAASARIDRRWPK